MSTDEAMEVSRNDPARETAPKTCPRRATKQGLAALLIALVSVAACGGDDSTRTDAAAPVADGGIDAGGCDPLMPAGCACTDEGAAYCGIGDTGRGAECCDGTWRELVDGPCWSPPDAGEPMCGGMPQAGCACATEGAIGCPPFQWQVRCVGLRWTAEPGRVCCR